MAAATSEPVISWAGVCLLRVRRAQNMTGIKRMAGVAVTPNRAMRATTVAVAPAACRLIFQKMVVAVIAAPVMTTIHETAFTAAGAPIMYTAINPKTAQASENKKGLILSSRLLMWASLTIFNRILRLISQSGRALKKSAVTSQ